MRVQAGLLTSIGILFFFVAINILSSLSFPPLLYRLVLDRSFDGAVEYLQAIRGQNFFEEQYHIFANQYGDDFEAAVFAQQRNRADIIGQLETVLTQNNKSRDVLIKLAFLYSKNGAKMPARALYIRAKSIDPWLKVADLETL